MRQSDRNLPQAMYELGAVFVVLGEEFASEPNAHFFAAREWFLFRDALLTGLHRLLKDLAGLDIIVGEMRRLRQIARPNYEDDAEHDLHVEEDPGPHILRCAQCALALFKRAEWRGLAAFRKLD